MTGLFTPSGFRSNTRLALWCAALSLFAGAAHAQLKDGPGKAETEQLCSGCHEVARSVSLRQDRAGWQATVNKMVSLGAAATDAQIKTVVDYLAANYPAEEMPKLNVNKATAIELESRLSLLRSQAAAVIQYRTKNGDFKSIADLEKVPGIDVAKIEARKDHITF